METNDKGYYDIDIELDKALLDNGMIEEIFYLNDLKQRKLFLNVDVDQFSVADIVKHIMQYNAEDRNIEPEKRVPILLYVASNGGEVDSGFELIDIIEMDGQEYGLLLPKDDEESEEDKEVVLMRLTKEGEEYVFEMIEDDEEFNKVVDYIDTLEDSEEE